MQRYFVLGQESSDFEEITDKIKELSKEIPGLTKSELLDKIADGKQTVVADFGGDLVHDHESCCWQFDIKMGGAFGWEIAALNRLVNKVIGAFIPF